IGTSPPGASQRSSAACAPRCAGCSSKAARKRASASSRLLRRVWYSSPSCTSSPTRVSKSSLSASASWRSSTPARPGASARAGEHLLEVAARVGRPVQAVERDAPQLAIAHHLPLGVLLLAHLRQIDVDQLVPSLGLLRQALQLLLQLRVVGAQRVGLGAPGE